jgi:hypothetical protein
MGRGCSQGGGASRTLCETHNAPHLPVRMPPFFHDEQRRIVLSAPDPAACPFYPARPADRFRRLLLSALARRPGQRRLPCRLEPAPASHLRLTD